jgi:hypothetical protein
MRHPVYGGRGIRAPEVTVIMGQGNSFDKSDTGRPRTCEAWWWRMQRPIGPGALT